MKDYNIHYLVTSIEILKETGLSLGDISEKANIPYSHLSHIFESKGSFNEPLMEQYVNKLKTCFMSKKYNEIAGEKIRNYRYSLGLSVKYVAEKLSVDPKSIVDLESRMTRRGFQWLGLLEKTMFLYTEEAFNRRQA